MNKMYGTAIGLGIAGALVGMSIYMSMPSRQQKQIQRGMRDMVDELRDITDRMC